MSCWLGSRCSPIRHLARRLRDRCPRRLATTEPETPQQARVLRSAPASRRGRTFQGPEELGAVNPSADPWQLNRRGADAGERAHLSPKLKSALGGPQQPKE
jgi:hypothetical protein